MPRAWEGRHYRRINTQWFLKVVFRWFFVVLLWFFGCFIKNHKPLGNGKCFLPSLAYILEVAHACMRETEEQVSTYEDTGLVVIGMFQIFLFSW